MLLRSQCYVGRFVAHVPASHFATGIKYGRIRGVTPSGKVTIRVTNVDGKRVRPFLVTVDPLNVHSAPWAFQGVGQTELSL